jgi:hypothetical protein
MQPVVSITSSAFATATFVLMVKSTGINMDLKDAAIFLHYLRN